MKIKGLTSKVRFRLFLLFSLLINIYCFRGIYLKIEGARCFPSFFSTNTSIEKSASPAIFPRHITHFSHFLSVRFTKANPLNREPARRIDERVLGR